MSSSEHMSRIRSKDTRPKRRVRRALWAAGLRYSLHVRTLPRCPNIVFADRRAFVQIRGCFFHAHKECANFRLPKTRTDWWVAKLARNVERDAAQ